MKTKIKIGEKTYNIEIQEQKGKILVKVDNEEFIFSENESGKLALSADKGIPEVQEGEIVRSSLETKEIRSPLAGILSEIFVKEGQEIKAGQKILSIISMKMENEIVSETTGRVKEIKVKKDQNVNKDDVLITFE